MGALALEEPLVSPEEQRAFEKGFAARMETVAACFPQNYFGMRALEMALFAEWITVTGDVNVDSKELMRNYSAICDRYSNYLRRKEAL